jgi:diguanylate cyclase (GGDEF)-like protein/PAS domain S-box-containing protein
LRVLIAEDDENSRLMLTAALTGAGYAVTAVVNGQEALRAVERSKPDLIISDILMPKLDGFGLCRTLKANPQHQDIPFIFYTATYTDSRDGALGMALGAQRFLIKPMDVEDLLAVVADVSTAEPLGLSGPDLHDAQIATMQIDALRRKLDRKVRELEAANQSLRLSEERLRQIADHIRECFWVINADGSELEYASAAFCEIWGFTPEPGRSTRYACTVAVCVEDRSRYIERFATHGETGNEERYRIQRADGSLRWLRDYWVPVRHGTDPVQHFVGVTEDITEAQTLSEELRYRASRDPLTGLVNRNLFDEQLNMAICSAAEGKSKHALCYLDLDQFKVVNDTYGHLVGDALLIALAQEFKQVTRPQDILARMGGDEFALLVRNCSVEEAERFATTLRTVVENFRFEWQGAALSVAVSIGLVVIDEHAESASRVLSAADFSCYAAKEYGGNNLHVYRKDDPEVVRRLDEMQWVARINNAIADNRLRLYHQPITATERCPEFGQNYCEVLLRMIDEFGQIIEPGQFLPAAERYYVAPKVDRWVIREALAWLGKPTTSTPIGLCSINLSGVSVADDTFYDYIEEQLTVSGVRPAQVCFEITETSAVTRVQSAQSLCKRLRRLGCRVALDDFGAGVSSFVYLKNFDADIIKIDGTFVRGMLDNSVDLAIVKSIIEVGQQMNKRVVAESVESEQILNALRRLQIDYVQGYALGRPVPCIVAS